MRSPDRPQVGLLALTLELYETLAPTLRASREAWVRQELLPALGAVAMVHFERAIFCREEIEPTVARYEAAGVDALLVVFLSYSPSQGVLPALQRTPLPLVIWNTQECRAVDQRYSLQVLLENHGVHGTQDLANVLTRSDVLFHYVTSEPQEPAGLAELGDFFAAAAAVRRARSARIGQLGHAFPGMGDFAVDTTQLVSTWGCSVVPLTVADYVRRSAAATPADVDVLVADYRRRYAVAADVTVADLEASARAELAVRALVTEHGLSAWTFQFLALGEDERTSTLPFVGASRLMADGVGFGGEGDLIAALGHRLLHTLCPPASFTEMFTIDFAGDSLFFSHMGEANVAMAREDRPVPLVARPTPITRTRDRQLALVTAFAPGPATFASLTLGPGGRWRWITAPGTIEDFGPLPGLCVPHFKFRPLTGARLFLTRYAEAGGPHHNAVCFGDARRRLRFAARLAGVECVDLS